MATKPTVYRSAAAAGARASEVPNASWTDGMNWAGSNAPGIGINMEVPDLVGEAQQFTLADQAGADRDPQLSAHLGITPTGIEFGENGGGDGSFTVEDTASLTVLATGWAATGP